MSCSPTITSVGTGDRPRTAGRSSDCARDRRDERAPTSPPTGRPTCGPGTPDSPGRSASTRSYAGVLSVAASSSSAFSASLPSFSATVSTPNSMQLRIEARRSVRATCPSGSSASTRSGCRSTTRRATMPPIEWPSSRKRSSPTASATAIVSATSRSKRVRGEVVGLVALAVPPVVEHDHRVVTGQFGHVVGEVLLRSAESVHEHEPRPGAGDLDREPDPVVRRDAHAPWSRTRPRRCARGPRWRPLGCLAMGAESANRAPDRHRGGSSGRASS